MALLCKHGGVRTLLRPSAAQLEEGWVPLEGPSLRREGRSCLLVVNHHHAGIYQAAATAAAHATAAAVAAATAAAVAAATAEAVAGATAVDSHVSVHGAWGRCGVLLLHVLGVRVVVGVLCVGLFHVHWAVD